MQQDQVRPLSFPVRAKRAKVTTWFVASRLERFERAEKLGLQPDPEVCLSRFLRPSTQY